MAKKSKKVKVPEPLNQVVKDREDQDQGAKSDAFDKICDLHRDALRKRKIAEGKKEEYKAAREQADTADERVFEMIGKYKTKLPLFEGPD